MNFPADGATPGQAAPMTLVESPNKPRPDDPLTRSVADMLRRIEINYDREGSGPGSRFEGQLLEDVQASAVIRKAIAAREPHAADGQRPLEQLAIAAFGAWIDATSAERALLSWSQRPESDRAAFRAAADAVRMMLDMPSAHPQPAPGPAKPDLGTAWRLLNEARAELAALRERLTLLATEWDADAHADETRVRTTQLSETRARARRDLAACLRKGLEGK